MRTDEHKHLHLWINRDADDWKLETAKTVGLAVLFLLSLFSWAYVLAVHDALTRPIRLAEIIANGIVLAGNLILYVGFYGYRDGFKRHVEVTYAISFVLSMFVLYVMRIKLPAGEGEISSNGFYLIMQFLIYTVVSAVMTAVPSLLDCGLMWLIVRIFGKADTDGPTGKK